MQDFFNFLISSLIGGTLVSAVGTVLLDRWKDRVSAQFNHELEKQLTMFESSRNWKERALIELYGPLVMQFDRTNRAIKRYKETDLFLEAEVLRKSNLLIRDLLLEKGHFISAALLDHAGMLVEHYDVWLAEYDRVRKPENPDLTTKFVYAGPQGYFFPKPSEVAFRQRFSELQQELYPGAQQQC